MKKIILLCAILSISFAIAQNKISGTVKDSDNEPLAGANVIEKGTTNGTTTDFDGKFYLTVKDGAILAVSYTGYKTKEVPINDKKTFNITLEEGLQLDEVIVTGTRTPPRSNVSSPLPVDILSAEDLVSTGQNSFDKALQYKIPSFNTIQTPVSDATSLLDPYEIRNMGPSRILILINGKRKNLSSLVYTYKTVGRGETGSDISGIPTDAIKSVQILRDGASAQYGSDAIAGVVNIILKNDYKNGSATLRTGITGKGDGEMIGVSINNGSSIGDDKGFINYTVDFSKINLANRPGTVDAQGEFDDFVSGGEDPISGRAVVDEFLKRRPDAGNINGSPKTAAAKFLVNGAYDVSNNTELYFNVAYVYKKGNSYANYRVPYWRTLEDYPYLSKFFPSKGKPNNYDGYIPTFEGDLNDYNATAGFKTKKNGWNIDVSFTTGGNSQTYKINDSHNRNNVYSPSVWIDENKNGEVDSGELTQGSELYRENSKRSFDAGGFSFSHNVGNIDISKILSKKVSIAFGSEFRSELFEIFKGELSSYDAGGADSFAGSRPENSGEFIRYNIGGYLGFEWDVTNDFLVNATARAENYSDFGNAYVGKLSSRYKFADDKYTLRGSISTGFRAPTLHQIYIQKVQYTFVAGKGLQVGGLVNNVSSQANALDIPKLDSEKSTNFTVGLGGKITNGLNFTIDYYNIAIKDRIVLSTEIVKTEAGNTALDKVLEANNLNDLSFFVNALDTKTSGLDVVLNYKGLELGSGKLNLNLSGNYTIENGRDGEVNNPDLISGANQSVVNETQEGFLFTSRPKTKWILGADYRINKFNFSLNNTYFGKAKFAQGGLQDLEKLFVDENDIPNNAKKNGKSDLKTEFKPKIVTDLGINFNATDKITIALNINNIFNVLPEWKFTDATATGKKILDLSIDRTKVKKSPTNLITFNQRYSQMTYEGSHFSQLGTIFNLSLNYRF